jgi:hypothetical protein
MSPKRRKLFGLFVVVALLLGCSLLLWRYWQYYSFAQLLHQKTDSPIRFVEFQANTDHPRQRIADPKKIKALKSWLLSTSATGRLASTAPSCICEIRFFFKDGHEEVVQHSPFREPLGDDGSPDVREVARIFYRGHDRLGPTAALAEILEPAK